MSELKWIWTVLAVFVIAFLLGYISGLNIPNHVEFGLDQKTIDYLETINLSDIPQNNCTNTNYNMSGCAEQYYEVK